ncbi:hypothetical protein C9374_004990 [Naegleria lovaniensis]|uniref:Uncharacterized protein n=1 Tax=Naegleria lovaniensis TaxID=51637 RepID=A0AA88GRV6_NAELO|nr:uncharacterized protein C9374_004990 [Naegleria lovaniensis]KAG2383023.1 hypothetical protein C9374_004990 [Naegleria lovaniensis]
MDLKQQKFRNDNEFMLYNGQKTSYTEVYFKLGNAHLLYSIENNQKCSCSNTRLDLERMCIARSAVVNSKARILDLEATKFEIQENSSTFVAGMVVRDDKLPLDECFILSTSRTGQAMTGHDDYFNMEARVDSNAFKIPSFCPTVDKCL